MVRYEGRAVRKRTKKEVFSFSCAQSVDREHKAKVPKGEKSRVTRRMDRFHCSGWMHLTLDQNSDVVGLSMKHAQEHVAYVDVELPEKWKDYIRQYARTLNPGKVRLLKTQYFANAVYYYWHIVTREEWRLADSPFKSAQMFVQQKGKEHCIALLEVETEPGVEVLAFYVTDFMQAWAKNTQELAMDSTWNTNGGNFELFAAVADANGAGLPLAFIFIRTSDGAAPGAKQTVLERFLAALKARGVYPEFTLTDKDWSEINAMNANWPDAKHQLCFWHGVRAIKQRLCKGRDAPGPYDATAANQEFSFIDIEFIPAADRAAKGLRPVSPQNLLITHPSDYQFCPASHRLPILRLFAKHACLHPLLPERHGQRRSAEDIYREAVEQMYRHCKNNRLPEVWAYLWSNWYCRSRWKLWARSAYPVSIPRRRTTMIVEALWRGLKRLVLHMYNRPPIDLALYSIVTKTLPRYRLTLTRFLDNPRRGRAAKLSHIQADFKKAWERLRKVRVRGTYTTDVAQWTCDCGAQKYHSHLLCKHLVQAVGPVPANWWPTVVRYHIPPFYTVPINGVIARPPEDMANHAWIERMRRKPSAIVPRPERGARSQRSEDSDADIPLADGFRSSSPISSSPDKAPATGSDGLLRVRAGGGCGFDLDDE
ncbi:hypothetical protein OH77DRAFT_1465898, partial [Trametes cingulata]